jgi:hypothetical protein
MAKQSEVGSKPDSEDAGESEEDVIFEGDAGIDYEQEFEELGGSEFFTPSEGTNEIKFVSEGTADTVTYDEDEGPRDVVRYDVVVDGEEFVWSVNKASSPSSLWGQLVKVARSKGGLEGEEITLIRNGTGTDTQYTVTEAADL